MCACVCVGGGGGTRGRNTRACIKTLSTALICWVATAALILIFSRFCCELLVSSIRNARHNWVTSIKVYEECDRVNSQEGL